MTWRDWRQQNFYASRLVHIRSVFSVKSNDFNSRLEIVSLNCDFDFKGVWAHPFRVYFVLASLGFKPTLPLCLSSLFHLIPSLSL